MAEVNIQSKLSSYKSFYTPLKGIVTRENTDDPLRLDRIQVRIPSYHGEEKKHLIGTGTDPGGYPWAQMCVLDFKENGKNVFSSVTSTVKDAVSNLFGKRNLGEKKETNIPIIYPKTGDTIWLMFEGGDIRCPIYMGSLSSTVKALAVSSGLSGLIGGDLAKIAAQVIMSNEGSYDSINWDDVGKTSVGVLQWRDSRAQKCFSYIREANSASFDSACASNNASDFVSMVSGSWPGLFSEYSAVGSAMSSIISTDYSKTGQDKLLQEDVSGYLQVGRDLGLTDPAALVFFADCYNQSPAGAESIVVAGMSLDDIYNASLNAGGLSGSSNWLSPRRSKTYEMIKTLQSQGAFNQQQASSAGGTLLWPVPGAGLDSSDPTNLFGNRINPYSGEYKMHNGVDIQAPTGTPCIAVFDGVVKRAGSGDGYGNRVDVYKPDGSMSTLYGHLSAITVSVNQTVTAGTVIGLVGSTGNSTGPHLHFSLFNEPAGEAIDPVPYIGSP